MNDNDVYNVYLSTFTTVRSDSRFTHENLGLTLTPAQIAADQRVICAIALAVQAAESAAAPSAKSALITQIATMLA